MTRSGSGPSVVVDLSNLCRDSRLLGAGVKADVLLLDYLIEALEASDVEFSEVHSVADRSLPPLLDSPGRRRLREMEQHGSLELSSIADERILEIAFGGQDDTGVMVASMDYFDDFRRTYPAIQGSTDRFLGWDREPNGSIRVFRRDMEVHAHQRLSRKEESKELKARRLHRRTIVDRASATYFRCENPQCLLAQLWPERLPELPRFDDRVEQLVCPSCGSALTVGAPRPASSQLIVFLRGVERFRLLLDDGERIVIGRNDAKGCVGLESRLPSGTADTVSRHHAAFTRSKGQVVVEDLGSRNGTAIRWADGRRDELRLTPDVSQVIGRRNTVALPSGVTIELSGRSIPLDGERPLEIDDADTDGRPTRLLRPKEA